MDIYMNALREFHSKYNHYMAEAPHIPPDDVIELRRNLIAEEADEFDKAAWRTKHLREDGNRDELIDNITEIADALADILYVVFGTALAYGIPIEKVFLEVHRSNMTKSMKKDEKSIPGKTIKGDKYNPPNIKQYIDTPDFRDE